MIKKPYLIFLDDAQDLEVGAKTGAGLVYWCSNDCIGQLGSANRHIDLNIPIMSLVEAASKGAKTLVVGVANFGGRINFEWIPIFKEALRFGLDIASGLHQKLTDYPELVECAREAGRRLIDIRQSGEHFLPATGLKRTGKRLLTVGTDCSVGKMYTALAIHNALSQTTSCTFRATGQTGLFVSGSGIAFDALKVDFVAAAVEQLSPNNDPDHWDIIEGQGALMHPSCSVVLTLLHASQPDALVICHDVSRKSLYGFPNYSIPTLRKTIDLNLSMARLTNPEVQCVGVSLNTSSVSVEESRILLNNTSNELGLPCVDPVRTSLQTILDKIYEI